MGEILIILIFIILGVIFRKGKGTFLIAGFNTLPAEEKEKYDIKAFTKFMSNAMFAFALIGVIFYIANEFNIGWLHIPNIIFLIIISMLILINFFGGKFKNV